MQTHYQREISKYEMTLLLKIAERAEALYAEQGVRAPDRLTLLMDLEHAHAHIPLDLGAMLQGEDTDFAHDIGGIVRHMDRRTGKLGDCFIPRFALRSIARKALSE